MGFAVRYRLSTVILRLAAGWVERAKPSTSPVSRLSRLRGAVPVPSAPRPNIFSGRGRLTLAGATGDQSRCSRLASASLPIWQSRSLAWVAVSSEASSTTALASAAAQL